MPSAGLALGGLHHLAHEEPGDLLVAVEEPLPLLGVGDGLLVRRALLWGLVYVRIWEGFVARSGTPAARLPILVYARIADADPPRLAAATPVALATPLVVTALALALTSVAPARAEVP